MCFVCQRTEWRRQSPSMMWQEKGNKNQNKNKNKDKTKSLRNHIWRVYVWHNSSFVEREERKNLIIKRTFLGSLHRKYCGWNIILGIVFSRDSTVRNSWMFDINQNYWIGKRLPSVNNVSILQELPNNLPGNEEIPEGIIPWFISIG
jgi:hypothetical protein